MVERAEVAEELLKRAEVAEELLKQAQEQLRREEISLNPVILERAQERIHTIIYIKHYTMII